MLSLVIADNFLKNISTLLLTFNKLIANIIITVNRQSNRRQSLRKVAVEGCSYSKKKILDGFKVNFLVTLQVNILANFKGK